MTSFHPAKNAEPAMRLSIVVPIYNERENIPRLYDALQRLLPTLGETYEIILVNDGSCDGSKEVLNRLAQVDSAVKVVHFRRNFGQTAAMSAGIEMASGEVIVLMDGDLQNDPSDIPMMLARLDEGYDLVHGWRKHRQDTFINRKLPSKIANWLISRVTRFPVHDLGCTLKAIRSDIAKDLRMYGEMHRFIPILAHWHGARCVEVVTKHHARQFGQTKYGIGRTFRVVLDLLTVKFMIQYAISPMKLFGGIGLLCGLGSVLSCAATVAMKLLGGIDMTGNPLLMLAGLLGTAAIQFVVLGLLGEVSARIYFESQNKRPYYIRELVNFNAAANGARQGTPQRRAA
jgi:glycosyltransferase involved in cell wall biosynthesis